VNKFKNIEDTTTTSSKVTGYVVPCDVSGSTVRVYGIHAEVDPRSGVANDIIMVIGLLNVVNPGVAYGTSANKFDVVHKRWSYPGGPVFKVHE
jgi:hypothetical protein